MKKNNSKFSTLHSPLIVIPAIKKNAIIPDQLVKKLNGITLIQRAIDIAKELTENILVITDSEEISLICERNGVAYYKDSKLKLDSSNIIEVIKSIVKSDSDILVYRANAPLVDKTLLISAYKRFLENRENIVVSVKNLDKRLLKQTKDSIIIEDNNLYYKELKAFLIFNKESKNYYPYVVDEEKSIEIESYQDWWVCEKLLQRKRIVFNVIGNTTVGMGHIYRALSLAHEIINHEIIFVCDKKDELAVDKIASKDYKVIPSNDVLQTILSLKSHLVINDILNTKRDFIIELKKHDIKVVNFEDLGDGAKEADTVFNELYDRPILKYNNILWGYEYYFLRDEFETAQPNSFKECVEKILITFGGTDQHNLTLGVLKNIIHITNGIQIEIVCGGGYLHKEELDNFLQLHKDRDIKVTYQTGIISKKMEGVNFAITSNGRTVYELVHMNIPSIVISQHEREQTHNFSKLENGFINLGKVGDKDLDEKIVKYTSKLIEDSEYRYLLYLNTQKYDFLKNKQRVIQKILELIE